MHQVGFIYKILCVLHLHLLRRHASGGRGYVQPQYCTKVCTATAYHVDAGPHNLADVYHSVYYSLLKIRHIYLIGAEKKKMRRVFRRT